MLQRPGTSFRSSEAQQTAGLVALTQAGWPKSFVSTDAGQTLREAGKRDWLEGSVLSGEKKAMKTLKVFVLKVNVLQSLT